MRLWLAGLLAVLGIRSLLLARRLAPSLMTLSVEVTEDEK